MPHRQIFLEIGQKLLCALGITIVKMIPIISRNYSEAVKYSFVMHMFNGMCTNHKYQYKRVHTMINSCTARLPLRIEMPPMQLGLEKMQVYLIG